MYWLVLSIINSFGLLSLFLLFVCVLRYIRMRCACAISEVVLELLSMEFMLITWGFKLHNFQRCPLFCNNQNPRSFISFKHKPSTCYKFKVGVLRLTWHVWKPLFWCGLYLNHHVPINCKYWVYLEFVTKSIIEFSISCIMSQNTAIKLAKSTKFACKYCYSSFIFTTMKASYVYCCQFRAIVWTLFVRDTHTRGTSITILGKPPRPLYIAMKSWERERPTLNFILVNNIIVHS